MKKIFAFLLVAGISLVVYAGVVVGTMTASTSSSVDSIRCISNTPNYLYAVPTQDFSTAVIQATVTRVSAAIGGTIFLQGSVDNSNWHTATYAAGDTVTVADAASQVLKIYVAPTNGLPYKYYRLKCTGASSDTMTVRAKFCAR